MAITLELMMAYSVKTPEYQTELIRCQREEMASSEMFRTSCDYSGCMLAKANLAVTVINLMFVVEH
ncbi:hypothetical protein AB4160_03995 [Shewanella sp. 10N.286.51.B8]|uniref:hypothetical protein n=1 Tax=Shewanella sp. 10N.286.51.B8 TaxID=3229708 RepID=UPI00354BD6DA